MFKCSKSAIFFAVATAVVSGNSSWAEKVDVLGPADGRGSELYIRHDRGDSPLDTLTKKRITSAETAADDLQDSIRRYRFGRSKSDRQQMVSHVQAVRSALATIQNLLVTPSSSEANQLRRQYSGQIKQLNERAKMLVDVYVSETGDRSRASSAN